MCRMMVACCGCSDDWAVIDTDKLADRLGGAPLRESLIAHFLGYPSHFICLAGLFDEIPKFLFCGVSRPLIFVACADKARQISFGLDPCICVVVDADDERCARTGLLFRPAVSNIYRAPVARRSRRADRIRHGTAQAPCRLAHRRSQESAGDPHAPGSAPSARRLGGVFIAVKSRSTLLEFSKRLRPGP
jgi:hypothetical protein